MNAIEQYFFFVAVCVKQIELSKVNLSNQEHEKHDRWKIMSKTKYASKQTYGWKPFGYSAASSLFCRRCT